MRTLSLFLILISTSCFGQTCFTGNHRVVTQNYSQPRRVVKQQVYSQPKQVHQKPQVVYEKGYGKQEVLDLLGELLHEQQKYVSYAEAPYAKGTTHYSVKDFEVEAFQPKDVREIIAAVSRYSTQANSGANQLMGQAQQITQQITSSVSSQSQTALEIATAEAEARGVEATSRAIVAMIEALEGTRLNKQGRLSIKGLSTQEVPPQGVPPAPSPVAGLQEHCSSCHGPDLADPKGGFVLHAPMSQEEIMSCTKLILSGKMPKGSEIDQETKMKLLQELQGISQ